ncbi:ABC transporter ATP-binding protein [Naumannella halotolerans]|uniref:Peptide/nickel transport system ATP-binding protein/oligopeptide transport system ATP-binding protein n=1 Tax=Naumannella halotolerans TaxID=993414 RepID=A0A4R7J9F6_9ACTN|nr:ATP-binding cassette domain-containing protein [Naumannella halotolerans]TDT33934.1 peptide/nickel transport system ATP-binding protein/oligopeptide transport system ATP-binding protein [Naumannella halotolerans]
MSDPEPTASAQDPTAQEPTAAAPGRASVATPESDPVLEIRHLVKTYPVGRGLFGRARGEIPAVQDVSLTLQRGRTLGVVGESGSGKSTVAKILVGVEKPTSGQVLLEGSDITAMTRSDRHALRNKVQMIFQDPYTSLNPRMSVGDIIGEAYTLHPDAVGPAGKRASVDEMLELVGLSPDHRHRYPHQFSGGQRQRIGIARALAVKPEVLICDEPVSALDVSIQGQVINLLRRLQRELGLTYLFIAHDLAVVRSIAHEVAVMHRGKVVESGPRDQLYDTPAHDYTKSLLAAVPEPDPRRRRRPIVRR